MTTPKKKRMKGDWNEKNMVKDQSLNKMMSLNSMGNRGYWMA